MKIPPVIDDKYVEEELKKEAEAFASEKGENTGFCLRGLCGQDVSEIDMSKLSIEMFKRLTFDTKTTFSQEQIEKFHPFDIIMERGKQFGNIEDSEIDGSGTTIAIIDRFSDISENQFEGRTITVYRVSEDGIEVVQPNEGVYLKNASVEENGLENGFHGNTIESLTVGKECGIAPNANVVLFHIDGIGNKEAQDSVLKFIDENREKEGFTIPDIISVSARSKGIDGTTLDDVEKLGCAFISSERFMEDFTWGRSNDGHELVRDEFIQYTIDAFADRGTDINELFDRNTLIPVTGRTSSYTNDDGEEVYKYNGSFCGNSFAICQVAGLFLLARQIQPQISYDEFINTIKESQKENSEHRVYVDPKDIIEKIKEKSEAKGKQFDATLSPEDVLDASDEISAFESQVRSDFQERQNEGNSLE